jgi:hypothetical protein
MFNVYLRNNFTSKDFQINSLKEERWLQPRRLGPYDSEDDFFEAFNLMKAMVEEMYKDQKKAKGESTSIKIEAVKEEGEGEEPPESSFIPIPIIILIIIIFF